MLLQEQFWVQYRGECEDNLAEQRREAFWGKYDPERVIPRHWAILLCAITTSLLRVFLSGSRSQAALKGFPSPWMWVFTDFPAKTLHSKVKQTEILCVSLLVTLSTDKSTASTCPYRVFVTCHDNSCKSNLVVFLAEVECRSTPGLCSQHPPCLEEQQMRPLRVVPNMSFTELYEGLVGLFPFYFAVLVFFFFSLASLDWLPAFVLLPLPVITLTCFTCILITFCLSRVCCIWNISCFLEDVLCFQKVLRSLDQKSQNKVFFLFVFFKDWCDREMAAHNG